VHNICFCLAKGNLLVFLPPFATISLTIAPLAPLELHVRERQAITVKKNPTGKQTLRYEDYKIPVLLSIIFKIF